MMWSVHFFLFELAFLPFATSYSTLTFTSYAPHAFSGPRRRFRHVAVSQQDTTEDIMDDEKLLKEVTESQLVGLCKQFELPTEGSKEILLRRLREYAEQQLERERKVLKERVDKVEQGSENDKERYELAEGNPIDDNDDDEDAAFFYYHLPGDDTSDVTSAKPKASKPKKARVIDSSVVTAPPPPLEPNEDGERVVTIYSTTDTNDLTGVAAAQPGQSSIAGGDLTSVTPSIKGSQPWEMESQQKTTTTREIEQAKEQINELVQVLLAMTGAPAFAAMVDDDELAMKMPSYAPRNGFVGFDPSLVPQQLLSASSQALRTSRGAVLADVLRQYELQGIGQDGMAGDDTQKGGGHYREVSKVRAFLEGFRRAEVRRLARETTVMLLDKLVSEGVDGLDLMLASMTKSSDDASAYAGELNDSLLEYLNDAIRQQQAKVDQLVADSPKIELLEEKYPKSDQVDALWEVSYENGEKLESIDPNNPTVQKTLREAYGNADTSLSNTNEQIPDSAAEKLLLLLTLLRERIKVEAAFAPDEKGRNLRLLAYCLRLQSDREREQLILNSLGSSLDVSYWGGGRSFARNLKRRSPSLLCRP
ncbi:hypothetical protein FisN_1Hh639 [Fistulifera solaris]|uniref:SAP domain-containing protein n=1 Tax=Fistulifera solaris TaxID=1519565 RepID=A0A1Z5KRF1_FISSO|nr:hypothetical protein FisN_1Hh639 [Fistulifera solaris]|eukprot:GAX28571.1 hypothetical protein FisN_1Hh639 [Fistulifera solaris]